jgi:glycosyltransferase involved in cell wall biosynthesis
MYRVFFEQIDHIPIYRLSVIGPRITGSTMYILRILIWLRRLKPDVIHSHELLLPTTAAVVAKYWLGTPLVATAHNSGLFLGEVERLKRSFLGKQRIVRLHQKVDKFVAISQLIDSELAAIDIPADQRILIPNGVDVTCFTPLALDEKRALRKKLDLPDVPIAIFTGRLASEKRVGDLLAIWPAVRKVHSQALLVIVGTGPLESALREAAVPGVRFVGSTSNVAPYLQTADLFILPSVAEGLSVALLEAMATGLPIIATNVGGIHDLITHSENGWLIPPDNNTALQDAVSNMLGNQNRCIDFGQRGREIIVRKYSVSAVATRLGTVYSQLVDQDDPSLY